MISFFMASCQADKLVTIVLRRMLLVVFLVVIFAVDNVVSFSLRMATAVERNPLELVVNMNRLQKLQTSTPHNRVSLEAEIAAMKALGE